MSTHSLTATEFRQTVRGHSLVLIDFWAPWCPPCRAFGPIFERVAAASEGVHFAKVNTEDEPALASALGVRAIPTLMAFVDGALVFEQAGVLPEAALTTLVTEMKRLEGTILREQGP